VLVGTSGQTGAFTQSLIETMASNVAEPVIMPLSNPTAKAEGRPADIIAWTDGRACIATGSPFDPVSHNGREIHIGQGNNVFIFPALGLGALLSQATKVTNGMITRTAQVLAQQVSAEELESGLLYPNVDRLREVTVASATAVYEQAYEDGVASAERVADAAALVRDSMWWPDYPTYV
jgi:malate dehydrogenase (oxaloacetate-decarboxylating)